MNHKSGVLTLIISDLAGQASWGGFFLEIVVFLDRISIFFLYLCLLTVSNIQPPWLRLLKQVGPVTEKGRPHELPDRPISTL
jgi:hypothetical protein